MLLLLLLVGDKRRRRGCESPESWVLLSAWSKECLGRVRLTKIKRLGYTVRGVFMRCELTWQGPRTTIAAGSTEAFKPTRSLWGAVTDVASIGE